MQNGKRFQRVFFYISIVILTGIISYRVGHHEAYSADMVREQLSRFQEVFGLVNHLYVEPPDKEKLVTGAIEGMLDKLDPHSTFIDKKQLERVTEQFQGSFEGIGIEFVILNKILTIVSPIVGGPSETAGLLPGDQIVKIEGESAYGITEDQVQKKLRGTKGSKVEITIQRPGMSENFDVTITRDEIPIYSVMGAFMLEDVETGYIMLGRFARTTSEEVEEALQKLENEGMKQLVFDLRGNTGGYLEQAWEVSDKFIPGQHKIVYTKGRTSDMEREYYSRQYGTHKLLPMVVLIDHGSASASEIVSGAIQDLDRGLVIGQTSFGKGLVQHQIPLRDGSALRLTVARYYTPSGRLIQRPYDEGSLLDYYQDAYEEDEERTVDSTKVFKTIAGRTVYGGGGITPDSLLESDKITGFTYRLRTKRVFFEFGSTFAANHRNDYTTFADFEKNFQVTDAMIESLNAIIKKHEIEIATEAMEKDIDYIKHLMTAEVARHLWDREHYYRIRMTEDKEVQTAIALMPEAKRVMNLHTW